MVGAMGPIADAARVAGVPLRHVAGLQLVGSTDAIQLIHALRAAGLRIVGAEGFRLVGDDAVRPAMDAILDLSGLDDPKQSAEEAEMFLRSVAMPELWFEFSVREPAQD